MAEATEETGYLHFVMTESILVSGRHHALCAVDATRRALEAGYRIGSAAALFETIIENVADTMDRVAERIAQSLDEIEEQVLSDVASDLRQQLGRLRRTCVRLHRQVSGLRIVFLRLELLKRPSSPFGMGSPNTWQESHALRLQHPAIATRP
jgi:zinc transporter